MVDNSLSDDFFSNDSIQGPLPLLYPTGNCITAAKKERSFGVNCVYFANLSQFSKL